MNAAGNIQCWGSNAISQLSFPNDNNPHPNPTTYAAGRLISVGTTSECFLTADASGKVQCWGHGLLGDGASTATSNQSTPQFVCTMGTCHVDKKGLKDRNLDRYEVLVWSQPRGVTVGRLLPTSEDDLAACMMYP